jgi:hypothetical protein
LSPGSNQEKLIVFLQIYRAARNIGAGYYQYFTVDIAWRYFGRANICLFPKSRDGFEQRLRSTTDHRVGIFEIVRRKNRRRRETSPRNTGISAVITRHGGGAAATIIMDRRRKRHARARYRAAKTPRRHHDRGRVLNRFDPAILVAPRGNKALTLNWRLGDFDTTAADQASVGCGSPVFEASISSLVRSLSFTLPEQHIGASARRTFDLTKQERAAQVISTEHRCGRQHRLASISWTRERRADHDARCTLLRAQAGIGRNRRGPRTGK